MLYIISPYAAVNAHGAHRVGRHGARGKHLRHSCDLCVGLVVLPPVLLLTRVPMARRRREAAIGATIATIVRPWKNPESVPRTGRHVAAYVYIYHVRMGCTSQTTLITACHSVAPGSGKPFLVYQLAP